MQNSISNLSYITQNKRHKECCPFCNSIEIKSIKKFLSVINNKIYELYECKNCLLQFHTPLVFENVYESEIVDEYKTRHADQVGRYYSWTEKLVKTIKDNKINLENKKILDIGAGDGNNWVGLKKVFGILADDYFALELDKKSLDTCKNKGIKNIINYYFDSSILEKMDLKFDLIISTEVFEHQINPNDFIKSAFSLLNKNGLLIITVPNRERCLFKSSVGDIPPHHFLKFNKAFFVKNFKNIIFIEDYTQKSLSVIAKNISIILFSTKRFHIIFYPVAFIMKCLYSLLPGQGIIIILKS